MTNYKHYVAADHTGVTPQSATANVTYVLERDCTASLLDSLAFSLSVIRGRLTDARQIPLVGPQRDSANSTLQLVHRVRDVLLELRSESLVEENFAYQQARRWWVALVPFVRTRYQRRAAAAALVTQGVDAHLTVNSGFLNAWEIYATRGGFLPKIGIEALTNEIDNLQILLAQR